MPSSSTSRAGSAIFRCKALGLQMQRAIYDCRDGILAHPRRETPSEWKQLHEVRSPLWNDAGEVDADLERGKVQNVRVAARCLDGIYIEAETIFSFWKQVGRATKQRGFVAGRLLREGCLMPAVGGGLCQLSNALYELALRSHLEVIERHAHSRVVDGSAATLGRDATVAWNYVDLRFRSCKPLLIRAHLTRDELVVGLWGESFEKEEAAEAAIPFVSLTLFESRPRLQALAHSCASCGDTSCFRHDAKPRRSRGQCAWIVDEAWPEWMDLVRAQERTDDILLAARPNLWPTDGWQSVGGARLISFSRSVQARRVVGSGVGGSTWQAQLESSERIAKSLAQRLSCDVTELVVAQSLLPFLWQSGALGGRTYDVLLTRTPLDELSGRLDGAFGLVGDETLTDFRAPAELIRAERAALDGARMVYSPHEQLVELFGTRSRRLAWATPAVRTHAGAGRHDALVMAGSALARKGVYAVRDAARELGVPVVIAGRDWMNTDFWDGVTIRNLQAGENWLDEARVAVLPAAVEHAPRLLLRALGANTPVFASRECGLGERTGVTTVRFGDSGALIEALRNFF